MQTVVQDHLGLVIVSIIMVFAVLLLTLLCYQMRAAGLSLKPIAYIGVLFALVMVPQWVGHIALAIWPKPQAVFNAEAFAGRHVFEHPEHLFGSDANAGSLRDARPVFPDLLAKAEVAQLLIRETGEMTLAARFASAADAKESTSGFWTGFALAGTSGSEKHGWWGTRQPAGDIVHIKRIGKGLALWTGPSKEMVRKRLADVRMSTTPHDSRPEWIRIFDRVPVQIAIVLLLIALASAWFFKGASWAGRIDGDGAPVSAAELSQRISQTHAESLRQIGENRWELIIRYDTIGEVGRHRYLLRLDPQNHRVLVTEFISRRASPSGSVQWRKQTGMTFFRKTAGADVQSRKGPIVEAITSAGWDWQPVMWDVPAFSQ